MESTWSRIGALAAGILIVLIGGVYVARHHARPPVKAGDRVPALSFVNLDGAPATLEPRGGITVYNVFTTWCPSCREETPALAREAERLQARGISVVGIDQGESPQMISLFASQFGLRYPIVVDTNHVSNAVLGARVIPETIVVKDGIVKAIAVGPITPAQLDRMIGTV